MMSELLKLCVCAVVAMVVGAICIQVVITSIEHFVSKVSASDFPNEEEVDGISQPVTYQSYMFFSLPKVSFEVTGLGSSLVLLGVVCFFAGIFCNYRNEPRQFGGNQTGQPLINGPVVAPEQSGDESGSR